MEPALNKKCGREIEDLNFACFSPNQPTSEQVLETKRGNYLHLVTIIDRAFNFGMFLSNQSFPSIFMKSMKYAGNLRCLMEKACHAIKTESHVIENRKCFNFITFLQEKGKVFLVLLVLLVGKYNPGGNCSRVLALLKLIMFVRYLKAVIRQNAYQY